MATAELIESPVKYFQLTDPKDVIAYKQESVDPMYIPPPVRIVGDAAIAPLVPYRHFRDPEKDVNAYIYLS